MFYLCMPINSLCWSGLSPAVPPLLIARFTRRSLVDTSRKDASLWGVQLLKAFKKHFFQYLPDWVCCLNSLLISKKRSSPFTVRITINPSKRFRNKGF